MVPTLSQKARKDGAPGDRESAFGSEDRVLLDRVAGLLARFLAGPRGKYLVLRAAKVLPADAPQAAAA